MLIYRRTSILESTAQTLVNTVNCVGVMGKGLAKEFKERDPQMFKTYKRICDEKLLSPGKLWLWKSAAQWVLNFPTKDHWRNPSRIEWIEAGLEKFANGYAELGIREISFPRLGCGNGGLNWMDVKPIMERHLSPLKIAVFIHDHDKSIGLPEHLEHIPLILEQEFGASFGFSEFPDVIARASHLAGEHLIDLQSHERIHAELSQGVLSIGCGSTHWEFDAEDLWGVWVALQKGFLTQEKAGWTAVEGGRPLLSIISLLPNVRLVEILKFDSDEPELAVELKSPAKGARPTTANPNEQIALQWH